MSKNWLLAPAWEILGIWRQYLGRIESGGKGVQQGCETLEQGSSTWSPQVPWYIVTLFLVTAK